MVTQFVHAIHDRLVRIDVNKYVANTKDYPLFYVNVLCRFYVDILQLAQYYAEQDEVELIILKVIK